MEKGLYKKIIATALFFVLVFTLSSCGPKEDVNPNRTKEMSSYTLDEIYKQKKFGFFVMNGDDTFTPINGNWEGAKNEATMFDSSRYIWVSDSTSNKDEENYSRLTPVVTSETPLVAIFSSSAEMPDSYTLERFKPLGYTIGSKVSLSENEKDMFVSTSEVASSSDFAQIIKGKKLDEMLEVYKINDSAELPIQNVDTDVNVLIGLEKNKYYKFNVFVGTSTKELSARADTLVCKSKDVIELQNPIQKTDKGYFKVNLPDNLKTGQYYSLNDFGVFRAE